MPCLFHVIVAGIMLGQVCVCDVAEVDRGNIQAPANASTHLRENAKAIMKPYPNPGPPRLIDFLMSVTHDMRLNPKVCRHHVHNLLAVVVLVIRTQAACLPNISNTDAGDAATRTGKTLSAAPLVCMLGLARLPK